MQKLLKSSWFGAVSSGILAYVAICNINFIFSWICYVPFFIVIYNKSPKQIFKSAFIFGLTFSCFAFFWMIPGAKKFTGYSIIYGLGVFLISAVFYSLFFAALLYCFALLKKPDYDLRSITINSILAASLFCIAEALLMLISTGLPWFDVHSGNGLAENLYAVQPASIFGIHVLTFIVIVVNYLIAIIVVKRTWSKIYMPVTIVVTYMVIGFFLLHNFTNRSQEAKPFNIAILAENITPDIAWDDNTGNMLVKKLLDLNHLAVNQKANMALWSESGIPWTYKKDDDLVKEVFKITDPVKMTHILGINTSYTEDKVFNSAYCILPGGIVTGRYDKQFLLSYIEKPLNGWLMPFFSSEGYSEISDQEHSTPLSTPYGRAGVLICNEAAVPVAAANQVKQRAEFFVNMSNDGWFSDTYIVRLHFYYARLRAVESRKDIAINCNNGFSGLIKASGDIEVKKRSTEPFVEMVSVQPNKHITFASSYPGLFVYGCIFYVAIILALIFFKKYRTKKGINTSL
jgi:apolipoprotein N-acyltransferase